MRDENTNKDKAGLKKTVSTVATTKQAEKEQKRKERLKKKAKIIRQKELKRKQRAELKARRIAEHEAEKVRNRELRSVQAHILSHQDANSLKELPYRSMISSTLAADLYNRIRDLLVYKKVYQNPDYNAKLMAEELKTNTRYLSGVINARFGKNYSTLINEYRIKEAVQLLSQKRLLDKTVEEIGLMVGFSNRQSFYAAFTRFVGDTPRSFRVKMMEI